MQDQVEDEGWYLDSGPTFVKKVGPCYAREHIKAGIDLVMLGRSFQIKAGIIRSIEDVGFGSFRWA